MEGSHPGGWSKADAVVFQPEILCAKMSGQALRRLEEFAAGGKAAFKAAHGSQLKINSPESETSKVFRLLSLHLRWQDTR